MKISDYKTSDKLFVIGSGSSLNEISSSEWGHINQHDTLGFNFSFINNDHVPTFFTIEAMAGRELNEEGVSEVASIFKTLYEKKAKEYESVVKIVSDLNEGNEDHFFRYSDDLLKGKYFFARTVNGIASTEKQFRQLIRFLENKGVFDKVDHLNELFKFRATLTMVIVLGIKMGYKEIILCGIDLNDPRYFYQDNEKYPDLPFFRSSNDTPKHATIMHNDLFVSVDVVVRCLNEQICKKKGIKLFVLTRKSALSSFLPIYDPKEA